MKRGRMCEAAGQVGSGEHDLQETHDYYGLFLKIMISFNFISRVMPGGLMVLF